MDRDLKRAIVERFERDDEIDPALVVGERGGETRELQLREDSVADQFRQHRFHVRADGCVVRAEAEHLESLVVRQNEPAAWIEHAKTVRHVVERHVETRREHGGLPLCGHDGEKIGPETRRIALHEGNKGHKSDNYRDRIPSARDEHRGGEGEERGDKLKIEAAVDGVAAAQHSESVCDRYGRAEELPEGFARHAERKQRPERYAC